MKEDKKESTGFYDDYYREIFIGDKLKNKNGYTVIVVKGEDGIFFGKLICDDSNSCKDMPYHLNKGKGHFIIH